MSENPTNHQPDNTIVVRKLTKHYGPVRAVDNISFEVKRGEIVGFLGPNGAGKSTTLRILSGLMNATSGEAWLCGDSVAAQPELTKCHIGYMPENNPLPEDLRVIEYLHHRAALKGIPRSKRKARVEAAMEVCELQHKARRKIIGNLSKGFRQRVGIADAILAEPEIIIMDEPTIGLDPHQVLGIRELIKQLRGKMTVILSSHILSEIELSCDRVIIINQGSIVAQGSTRELRHEFLPNTRYILRIRGEHNAIVHTLSQVDKEMFIVHDKPHSEGTTRLLTVETPKNDDQGNQLIKAIQQADNLELFELKRKPPSLEDIFLAATKRSWKESLPATSSTPEPQPTDTQA